MIRCNDCGRIYDFSDELRQVQESRGEFWGMPAYETMYYCWCGSDELDYDAKEDIPDEIVV